LRQIRGQNSSMATSGDYLGGAITAREFYDAAISSLRSCLKEENINKQFVGHRF
jgi:hypothetical protein